MYIISSIFVYLCISMYCPSTWLEICYQVPQIRGTQNPTSSRKRRIKCLGEKCPSFFHEELKHWKSTWVFPKMMVPPKSSILIGFSIINHRFWGTPVFGNIHFLDVPGSCRFEPLNHPGPSPIFFRSSGNGTLCGGKLVSENVFWGQICNLGKWLVNGL